MAIASLSGINSGLDSQGIINNLVSLEAQPIELMISQQEREVQKLSVFQELKSRLQTFKSVVNTINTDGRLLSTKGQFSNNDTSSGNTVVDITSTSSATSGTFSLNVTQLAKETKIVSEGYRSTGATVPSGTVEIFDGTKTVSIIIDSSNNTVDGLRLAINNSGANVSASFLNDGDPTNPIKLLISGTKTGVNNEVTIQHFIGGLGGNDTEVTSFTQTQAAQNALMEVDGIAISKNSNVVNDVLPGVTLSLQSVGTGVLTLSTDTNAVTDKISNFVEGFNDLMLFIGEQLKVDVSTNQTGTLFGNFTVQNLQQTLRSTITNQVQGVTGQFNFLAQIGISTQSDGTLLLDKSEFTSALASDPQNVSKLFTSTGSTSNVGITFVGFTKETQSGSYDIRVQNGVPQLSKAGENNYVDAVGGGNFYAGAEGTDAEGLNFRVSSLSDGSYGSITLTLGVGEILNRSLNLLVDTSLNGPLSSEIDTVEDTISDFDTTILKMEERLLLFEEDLQRKFTNMEIVVGRLNSQKDTFSQALAGIQDLFKSK
ncbi:MAG: flagellar filament capping protein FliD [Candidatus Nitrohelix vancouverensis]|uniref:Flagellar hook-associated protein 2 n=1 Tax=Candidatus Nitrohelix vancouverensis TaxID=2705534 RepID=A0A7T0C2X1_9BACT|nr:MAG: flagellar filament capping protein FliD [Candidatus Nitrohelix vancouverensis]